MPVLDIARLASSRPARMPRTSASSFETDSPPLMSLRSVAYLNSRSSVQVRRPQPERHLGELEAVEVRAAGDRVRLLPIAGPGQIEGLGQHHPRLRHLGPRLLHAAVRGQRGRGSDEPDDEGDEGGEREENAAAVVAARLST